MILYQERKKKRMKKLGKLLFLGGLVLISTTGCFKRDTLEDIEIVTTVYPIEYITNKLYGEHAIVNSIYPDDTNPSTHVLTEKQLDNASKKELFIYNGLSSDRDIATSFLERNKNMLIIDSAFGMELNYGIEELWLNPSHLLMMSQNVRNGLKEYISNNYLKKEIDKHYDELKVTLSELDAEIKLTAENAKNKTLLVDNDVLKYLEKYGFQVISLDASKTKPSEKVVSDVRTMIDSGEINYIFSLERENESELAKMLIEETNVEKKVFRRVDNLTDQERDNKEDYFSIMNENIESLKEETYQ